MSSPKKQTDQQQQNEKKNITNRGFRSQDAGGRTFRRSATAQQSFNNPPQSNGHQQKALFTSDSEILFPTFSNPKISQVKYIMLGQNMKNGVGKRSNGYSFNGSGQKGPFRTNQRRKSPLRRHKIEESNGVFKNSRNQGERQVAAQMDDWTSKRNRPRRRIALPDVREIDYVKPNEEWKALDDIILKRYNLKYLTPNRLKQLTDIVEELQTTIRSKIENVRLDLFGSCVNGLGSSTSDIDICFRYAEDIPPEDQQPIDVITKLAKILKNAYPFGKFYAINARVPIVKFRFKKTDGDISYYNDTALKNTALLKKYTEWEPIRFPQLIVFLKMWASDCNIKNSPHGTLSSYALTLMLIHFLQQCSPPVFPPWTMDEKEAPEAYDFVQVDVQSDWSLNKESVGQLFVGFLDYYSRFDWNNLISILRKDLVPKSIKTFNTRKNIIAIEDPYLEDFNPGYVVKEHKFRRFLAIFRRSREIFMGKFENPNWTTDLIHSLTDVYVEDDFTQFVLDGLNGEEHKTNENTECTKKDLLRRCFKTMVACRGEGRMSLFFSQYLKTNGSYFRLDRQQMYAGEISKFYRDKFFQKYVEWYGENRFKLKDNLFQEVNEIIDKASGFTGEKEKENLEEGARRIFSILIADICKTGMRQDRLMKSYRQKYGIEFSAEERQKYFNTDDFDRICDKLKDYGLLVEINEDGNRCLKYKVLELNGVEKTIEGTMKKLGLYVKDNNKISIEEEIPIDGLKIEEENMELTEEEKAQWLAEGLYRIRHIITLSQNKSLNRQSLKQKYKKSFGTALDEKERLKLFGISTFNGMIQILIETGTVVKSGNHNYLYSLGKLITDVKKEINSTENHPYLN